MCIHTYMYINVWEAFSDKHINYSNTYVHIYTNKYIYIYKYFSLSTYIVPRSCIYGLWEAFNDIAEGFGLTIEEFEDIIKSALVCIYTCSEYIHICICMYIAERFGLTIKEFEDVIKSALVSIYVYIHL
jgi:hypothetical protein